MTRTVLKEHSRTLDAVFCVGKESNKALYRTLDGCRSSSNQHLCLDAFIRSMTQFELNSNY